MVAVYSSTSYEPGATRPRRDARDAPVRAPEPPAPILRRRASDAERAQYLTARMVTPFIAQVLAQLDGEPEPADPRDAAAAYLRAGAAGVAPLDLVMV